MSSDDSADVVTALYMCQACGVGFKVEYSGVEDLDAFTAEVQHYADGCPSCGSNMTNLLVAAR